MSGDETVNLPVNLPAPMEELETTSPHERPPDVSEEPAARPLPTIPGYTVLQELGRGANGVVFQATQQRVNRLTAIKMILSSHSASSQDLVRFLAEGEILAMLSHPNIVQVYEVGEADDCPFLALEYVDGGSLAKKLAESRPSIAETITIGEKLARAVHTAHGHGITHRDLKPANILLTREGEPKITDFGLARLGTGLGMTATGAILGTPSYMSPEQTIGDPTKIGPPSDIWAIGVILFEMLAGRPPYVGRSAVDIIMQISRGDSVALSRMKPELHRDLVAIVMSCLDHDPKKRYHTAEELAEDLARFRNGEPVHAQQHGAWEHLIRWVRRKPSQAALIAVSATTLLILLAGGIGFLAYLRLKDANQKTVSALDLAKEFQYYHHITLAHAGWKQFDIQRMEHLLDTCPTEPRDWEWQYLKNLPHQDLQTLSTQKLVEQLAVSPDGTLVAVATAGTDVELHRLEGGQLERLLVGHTGKVNGVTFSRDGQRIATSSSDSTVRVWKVANGECIRTFRDFGDTASGVAFSPDGQTLAACSSNNQVRLWKLDSGETLLSDDAGRVCRAAAISPDGTTLAVGTRASSEILIYDLVTRTKRTELRGHSSWITQLAFSPDSSTLASSSIDWSIKLWDVKTANEIRTLRGHVSDVRTVAFSPDGTELATGGTDQSVRIWDKATGKLLTTRQGHTSGVMGVAYLPDGRVISGGKDQKLKIWSTRGEQDAVIVRHKADCNYPVFHPNGKWLAYGVGKGTIRLWDFEQSQLVRDFHGHEATVYGVAIDPDGKYLLSGSADKTVRLWEIETGREVQRFLGHTEGCRVVLFHPDGRRVASCSGDATCRLWDRESGKELRMFRGSAGKWISSFHISPDGRLLAAGSGDGIARVWDLDTGELKTEFTKHGNVVETISFLPDGKEIASGGGDSITRVWNIDTGVERLVLKGHSNWVEYLRVAPNGRRIITTSSDLTIRWWDLASGQELLTLRGHTDGIEGIALNADGTLLASAARDGTVRIWNGRPTH